MSSTHHSESAELQSGTDANATAGEDIHFEHAYLTYEIQDGRFVYDDSMVKVVSFHDNPDLLTGHILTTLFWHENVIPVMLIDQFRWCSLLLDMGQIQLSEYIDQHPEYLTVCLYQPITHFDGFTASLDDDEFLSSYFLTEFWRNALRTILGMYRFFHENHVRVGPIAMHNLVMVDDKLKFQNLLLEELPRDDSQENILSRQSSIAEDYAGLWSFIDDALLEGKGSLDPSFNHLRDLLTNIDPESEEVPFESYIYNIQNHFCLLSLVEKESFILRCSDNQKYFPIHHLQGELESALSSMHLSERTFMFWKSRITKGTPLAAMLLKRTYKDSGQDYITQLLLFFRISVVHMFENNKTNICLSLSDIIFSLEIVFPGFMAKFQAKLAEVNMLKFMMEHHVPPEKV